MSMFALQLNDTSRVILCLATTLLAAFAVSRLTKLAHLPNVTGYILAGIFIGPYCLGLVDSEMIRSMGFITDIALAFIAFGTGRYFKWSSLRRSGMRIFVLTAMESLVAGALVVLVMRGAFHLPLSFSLLLGAIASATAPASTLMTIRQYKAKGHFVTTLLQVVALDDAVSLLAFSVCAAIAQMSESATGSMAATVALPIVYNVLAIGLGVGLALLLKVLLRRVHSAYNRLLLAVIMLLEIAGVCSAVNISPLLSCMVFGAVHANVSKGETLFKKVDRFTPPILTVFFVVSGMRLEVPALASAGVIGLAYFFVRILGKLLGAGMGATLTNDTPQVRKYLGLALIPNAGVSIGLAALGERILSPSMGALLSTVILSSAVLYELVGPACARLALVRAGVIGAPDTPDAPHISETPRREAHAAMQAHRGQRASGMAGGALFSFRKGRTIK